MKTGAVLAPQEVREILYEGHDNRHMSLVQMLKEILTLDGVSLNAYNRIVGSTIGILSRYAHEQDVYNIMNDLDSMVRSELNEEEQT